MTSDLLIAVYFLLILSSSTLMKMISGYYGIVLIPNSWMKQPLRK
jgi:hypothetical protein